MPRWLTQLRARVAFLLAASSLLVLVVLYVLVVPPLQQNLKSAREQRLVDTVHRALPRLRQDIGQENTDVDLSTRLAELITSAHVQVWEDFGTPKQPEALPVADSHGHTLQDAPRFVVDALRDHRPASGSVTADGQTVIRYAVPFTTAFGNRYIALFSAPIDVTDTVTLVESRMLLAGGIALAVAIAVALVAAQGLTRRVRRLQRAAEQLTTGRFSEPIVDESSDEIGDLARSFDSMRIQLERLDRARKQFVANASHELRTPLTSLGGYVEMLGEGGLDAETRDEFVSEMARQVERLTKLASDLLDLSRLDAGEVHVAHEPMDLAGLAMDTAREAEPIAARYAAHLQVTLGSPRVLALADEGRVRQIVRALIDNALKHNPPGTTVTVAAGQDDGDVVVAVIDDGPPIPQASLDHLFERFYRGPGAAAQGSGLGLAIAQELASRMDGRLLVDSRPGRTAFTLRLPTADPVAEPTSQR